MNPLKKITAIVLGAVLALTTVGAQSFDEAVTRCDDLYDEDRQEEAISVIEPLLKGASDDQKVAIYWRLARSHQKLAWPYKILFQTKEPDEKGNRVRKNDVLDKYDIGIEYASKAIDLYENKGAGEDEAANAYHWRAVNTGQWAQTKGILSSLFRAGDMKDDLQNAVRLDPTLADSWYVLCSMFTAVPGWSKEQAVEYGRKAVELENQKVASGEKDEFYQGIHIGLAEALVARGWDQKKRGDNKTDAQEARELVMPHKNRIEGVKASLGSGEKLKSADAQALLDIQEILDDID